MEALHRVVGEFGPVFQLGLGGDVVAADLTGHTGPLGHKKAGPWLTLPRIPRSRCREDSCVTLTPIWRLYAGNPFPRLLLWPLWEVKLAVLLLTG